MSSEEYYHTLLESGRMNGHQYFIPLSWNLLQAYSTQAQVEAKGYGDLYTAIPAEAEALMYEENSCMSNLGLGRADVMNYFMEVAGNTLIDPENGKLMDCKDEIQETAEFVKVFYDNFEKIGAIGEKYRNDFAGAVSHYTYLIDDDPFMSNVRYYQSVYPMSVDEEMYFTPFMMQEGGITAQVIQYGAISANTKNETDAWKLLQYLCDMQISLDFSKYDTQNLYYTPVNREVYAACVEELSTAYGPGPGKKVSPLDAETAQILRDIPERVARAVIPCGSLGNLIQECMEPYLVGEESFDICYENLLQKMELYLNE